MVEVPVADLFLTPASILVGALGVARTEGLKTGVSALGIFSSALWIWAYGYSDPALWSSAIGLLPILFGIAWFISLCIHGWNWIAEVRHTDSFERTLKECEQEVDNLSRDDILKILRTHLALKTTLN